MADSQAGTTFSKVPKLGPKVFEQAAGFLYPRWDEPLEIGGPPRELRRRRKNGGRLKRHARAPVGNAALAGRLGAKEFVDDPVGLPTVQDIIAELTKPGRDLRSEFRAQFADAVNQPGRPPEGILSSKA